MGLVKWLWHFPNASIQRNSWLGSWVLWRVVIATLRTLGYDAAQSSSTRRWCIVQTFRCRSFLCASRSQLDWLNLCASSCVVYSVKDTHVPFLRILFYDTRLFQFWNNKLIPQWADACAWQSVKVNWVHNWNRKRTTQNGMIVTYPCYLRQGDCVFTSVS